MFAAELFEELSCRPGPAMRYVVQALSNTFISIFARSDVELALISRCIRVWQMLFHTESYHADGLVNRP